MVKQFDIAMIDFGERTGSEQSGRRPAVIVQNNIGNEHSPTVIACCITSKIKKEKQPTHYVIRRKMENGLITNSMFLGETCCQVSKEKIESVIGHVCSSADQKGIVTAYLANLTGTANNEIIHKLFTNYYGKSTEKRTTYSRY